MNLRNLEKRQDAEKKFHDRKLSSERKYNYYSLGFTSIIFKALMSKIGNLEDKKVMDFGCGEGWLTKIIVNKGAEVWAFDISDEAVKKTQAMVKSLNLQNRVHVEQMSAEALNYDSNMFDLIVGNAILHHVDLVASLNEIKRVLKKGGKAYFMEPLGHNPLLNLYRKMTPHLRSKDEMPICFEQFSIIKDSFPKFKHYEYYLISLLALIWYFLGINNLVLKTRNILFPLDKVILRVFPNIRRFCWYSILEVEK
jgi:ubiquinone/menaquinone biosynthesis C-methylase UbiE